MNCSLDLVRADFDHSLCIQGAPGTGKTLLARAVDDRAVLELLVDVHAVRALGVLTLERRDEQALDILRQMSELDPENPLTAKDYPPGKLIALNDPSTDINS